MFPARINTDRLSKYSTLPIIIQTANDTLTYRIKNSIRTPTLQNLCRNNIMEAKVRRRESNVKKNSELSTFYITIHDNVHYAPQGYFFFRVRFLFPLETARQVGELYQPRKLELYNPTCYIKPLIQYINKHPKATFPLKYPNKISTIFERLNPRKDPRRRCIRDRSRLANPFRTLETLLSEKIAHVREIGNKLPFRRTCTYKCTNINFDPDTQTMNMYKIGIVCRKTRNHHNRGSTVKQIDI